MFFAFSVVIWVGPAVFYTRRVHLLLALVSFQAANQSPKLLQAAVDTPACHLHADCMLLHPLRRRRTRHAPPACRLHAAAPADCTPCGGGGHSTGPYLAGTPNG